MTDTISLGAATGWPLDDLTPLTQPWSMDAWGYLRPTPTRELLRLSAELAHVAYTMEVTPWLQAGWRDVTIQMDGDLTSGFMPAAEGKNTLERLMATWKLRRVQAKLKQKNTLGQMIGAVRQIKSSDTGKAVAMLHPLPDGRYAVAIGFMGTGEQAYDWISNFRMTAEDGTHRGFLQLCRQLEENEDAILFPRTAAELRLEKLTLRHVLEECRHENSRFLLFLAGHSQGSAVMQVWTQRKLAEDGVLPRHIVGCGFASPTVVRGDAVRSAASWPLLHVVNSDDLVPHMGAAVHLGELLLYTTRQEMRDACYGWPMDAVSCRNRALVRNILSAMKDTPSSLLVLTAYLRLLAGCPVESIMEQLRWMQSEARPVRRLAGAVDAGVDGLLHYLTSRCEAAYLSMTGHPMRPQRVAQLQRHMEQTAAAIGMRGMTEALRQLSGAPHTMVSRQVGEMGVYPWITVRATHQLAEAHWAAGGRPVLLRQDGAMPVVCLRRYVAARRAQRVPHRRVPRARNK